MPRPEQAVPFVPEVPRESHNPVVRADGGHRSLRQRDETGEAPLVPDCS